jgi:hypothetical protein
MNINQYLPQSNPRMSRTIRKSKDKNKHMAWFTRMVWRAILEAHKSLAWSIIKSLDHGARRVLRSLQTQLRILPLHHEDAEPEERCHLQRRQELTASFVEIFFDQPRAQPFQSMERRETRPPRDRRQITAGNLRL